MTCDMDAVLDYWHSVEFFNSYDLDDQLDHARDRRQTTICVHADSTACDSWEAAVGQAGDLYLVPFDVSIATRLIDEHVAARAAARTVIERVRDEEMAPEGLTCFAKLTIGAGGRSAGDDLSVSALPWALGRLRDGELSDLSAEAFEADAAMLKRDFDALLGNAAEIDFDVLSAMVDRLHAWAGLAPRSGLLAYMVIKPANNGRPAQPRAALRTDDDATPQAGLDEAGADGDTEEEAAGSDLPILNSFYVRDLADARRWLKSAAPPRALRAYLASHDASKIDLDEYPAGQREIVDTLRPANGIAGRWPSAPRHVQSLMQQYSLNRMKTLPVGEILAVNGPPGTGKTTLLRDLIAHLLVERANVLAALPHWRDGLTGERVEAEIGRKIYPLPVLAPALTGFEIVVASTNNVAVENLSLELPQSRHVDERLRDRLSYFGPVATKYAGSHASKPWKLEEPVWGLVAAALGKRANRRLFSNVFNHYAATPNDKPGDRFLRNDEVDFDSWDAKGAMTYWRYWREQGNVRVPFRTAQLRFQSAHEAFEAARLELERLDARLIALEAVWTQVVEHCPEAAPLSRSNLEKQRARLESRIARLDRDALHFERRLGPSWIRWASKWIRRDAYRGWRTATEAAHLLRNVCDDLDEAEQIRAKYRVPLWSGVDLAHGEETERASSQKHAFWQCEALNTLRNELFASAMTLHEAFFLNVHAEQPRFNDLVFALSNLLLSRPPASGAKALWQWFFMLTPVVSSTFASVRQQFAGLGPEDLGWLVIDEAGQAVPQAAVGAMMRAQRVVAVGDPLQIPPVVTQSTQLLANLGEHWLATRRARFAVNYHSVQSFADRICAFGVRHPTMSEQFVGIPLIVHRRCHDPMFEIANTIAYGGRMLHEKKGKAGDSHLPAPHPVLGASDWWDIRGPSADESKYVAQQGMRVFDALVSLYRQTEQADGVMPDAFVITPFRHVKRGLVDLLRDRARWEQALNGSGKHPPADLSKWIRTCVGTVHTFQGKESDVVFFVLGCDARHEGAMDWASVEPNLLNVAVTRARKYLYVVGDRTLWGQKRHFDVALRLLTRHAQQAGVQAPASLGRTA
ncbi:hypothetical protein WI72_07620 [Burkholderia ubonensis]|nr:hypothetical protein WI72_07620 [Burkholderia ubonensis]KVD95546.1 hypothetical protein WI90_05095 [Burkholderia ubonensis]